MASTQLTDRDFSFSGDSVIKQTVPPLPGTQDYDLKIKTIPVENSLFPSRIFIYLALVYMALNYIILGLIFFAGIFLVLAAVFNAKFIFGQDNDSTATPNTAASTRGLLRFFSGIFNNLPTLPLFTDKKRSAYFFLGIVVIILGIVAIFTGFLNEEIKFE